MQPRKASMPPNFDFFDDRNEETTHSQNRATTTSMKESMENSTTASYNHVNALL